LAKAKGMRKAKESEGGGIPPKALEMLDGDAPPILFQGYNLTELGVPTEAYPQPDKPNQGKHSYTVVSANGAVF